MQRDCEAAARLREQLSELAAGAAERSAALAAKNAEVGFRFS